MVLNETIPKQPNPASASYDFIEFATNQGYIELYPANLTSTLGETPQYILTSSGTIVGDNGYVTTTDGGAALDIDFDLTVTKPINTGTEVYYNWPLSIVVSGGPSAIGDDFIVHIRKVSGGTETTLGTSTYSMSEGTTNNGTYNYTFADKITIPKTHFKIGDKIRITLAVTIVAHTGNQTWYFGTDPIDRTGADIPSLASATLFTNGARATVFFPVKLDLG